MSEGPIILLVAGDLAHARLIAASTASPATLHAIAESAGSAARIELSSSATAEVAIAPVARQPRPSWTPHLTRVFPASIALHKPVVPKPPWGG